jgi:TP901 family phage tail tape measure protein
MRPRVSDVPLQFNVDAQDTGAGALFDSLGGKLGSLSTAAAGAAAAGIAALGAGLTAVGVTSVNVAADFEAGMNRFASVTGSSITDAGLTLDDFKNKFLALGAETQFSAAQAQEAAIALAKGGVAIPDIMAGATQATLDLAAAGELELAPAADIVAKQLGVWAETGVTASQVADALAQAANASTVDVDELALGLSNVGGSAKVAGVDFGDLVQTMALIAPGFSSAADAGTSLKTMIARLIPTTDDARGAMRELGLLSIDSAAALQYFKDFGILPASAGAEDLNKGFQLAAEGMVRGSKGTMTMADALAALSNQFERNVFYDAQGQFLGMENAAQQLKDATSGLSEEQKAMAFNTIFGADAIRAAAAVANAGGEGFTAMGQAMGNAGSAADQAALRNQGFKFALDSLLGTVETIQIVLGSALLPILTTLINDAIIPAANGFLSWGQAILGANDPLAALLLSINGVLPGFSSFVAGIVSAWQAVQPLVDVLQANLVPILVGVAGLIGGLVIGGLIAFVAAWAPVIAAVTAAIAIGAALYSAWQSNFGGIQTVTSAVLGAVQQVVTTVVGFVAQFWQQNGDSILATGQRVWGQVQGIITTALQIVQTVVTTVLGAIASFWQQHGATIQQVASGAWTVISNLVQATLSVIQGALTAALQIMQGDWSGALNTILSTAQSIFPNLQQIASGAITAIKGLFTIGWDVVTSTVSSVWNGIQSAITGPVEAAQRVVDRVIGAIKGVIQSGIDAVNGLINTINSIPAVPDLPNVPGFAGGVRNFSGGLAIVGEQGPELVNLPRGSDVYTNAESRSLLGASAQPAPQTINNYYLGDTLVHRDTRSRVDAVRLTQLLES